MSKDNKKEKKQKHFFKDFKAELKKVIWPTPKQLVNNTTAVITIVIIVAAIVFILDFTFEGINSLTINKLKSIVGTTETNTVESEEITEESSEETTEESTETVEENTEAVQ